MNKRCFRLLCLLLACMMLTESVLSCEKRSLAATEGEYRTEVVYDPISVPAVLLRNAYVYQSDYTSVMNINDTDIKFKKDDQITVIGDKQAVGKKWFYVF